MKRLPLLLLAPALLAGCQTSRLEQRADVFEFLYPGGETPAPPSDVRLELPLRVGLAFVPAASATPQHSRNDGWLNGGAEALPPTLDETQRTALLERIRASFGAVAGVERIELVPSEFLAPAAGFERLDQLRGLLGIDVVALVSYEQTQYGGVNAGSLSYITGVGAFAVRGNQNETTTFVTTTVFDISSRALLFHASGASSIEGKARVTELNEELRGDSGDGFREATDEMIVELDDALASFQEQAKSGTVRGEGTPALAVVARPGYAGAGAVSWPEIVMGLVLCGVAAARRRGAA